MRPLVILNPMSQGGRTGARASRLARVVREHLGETDLVHTERRGHGGELAEMAAEEGRDVVIAVGGDGTIHEVGNGLMRARDRGLRTPKLGIIGQGTGGDFRRTLALEHRLERYGEAIARGRTRLVDVGRAAFIGHDDQPRVAYVLNILSVGLGGVVARDIASSSRLLGGTVAYFTATLAALARSGVAELRCRVTSRGVVEEHRIPTRSLAICNGRFFGGGMEVAPMAAPDDGVLHIVSLGDAPRIRFLLSSLSIYRGRHIERPQVRVLAGEAIEVDLADGAARSAFPLEVDGEPLGRLPLRVDVVPRALEVFVS